MANVDVEQIPDIDSKENMYLDICAPGFPNELRSKAALDRLETKATNKNLRDYLFPM